ncbi:MAG: cupin domain-containing protein [Candidatus Omnitrophica bacterium]|nr:cupin domain-containing protein [Candidatus Omnitrophota bacterium]
MKAFLLDDPRKRDLTGEELAQEGVLNQKLGTRPQEYQSTMDGLKKKNGYIEQDIVELNPAMSNLQEICNKFIDEHRHDEDEVRFILLGEGIFDIRSQKDQWMRVKVEQGDLIVVPAGRYHRFTLTEKKNIRCVRLFKDKSGWVPAYRSQELVNSEKK